MHLDAVDPGEAEVEDHEVGVLARRERQRRLAGRREVDVVAARLQVRAERPQELRLVVDDEDARHGAAFSRSTTVSPPPGVSSSSTCRPSPRRSPSRPRGRGRRRRPVAESPSRWNGTKSRSRSSAGTPGPRSTTRTSTIPSTAPAVTRAGCPDGRVSDRVLEHVRERPLEQARIDEHARQRLRDVDAHGAVRGAEAVRAPPERPPPCRPEPWSARACPTGFGSCREGFPRARRAGRSPRRSCAGTPARRLVGPLDVVLEQARDRRLDRGDRRAQVVRNGREERGSQLACGGQGATDLASASSSPSSTAASSSFANASSTR